MPTTNRRTYIILALLTFVNLFNYFDRFILAALVPAIQSDLKLNDLQMGILGTAFILVFFLISPVFAWAGDRVSRPPLIAIGVALWSLATAATGMASSFVGLLAARLCVGIGEASYATISPAMISDLFPKASRGRAFAIFFMTIPVGAALGYLLGGILEANFGWRHAFLAAGIPGLAFALALFFLQDPARGQHDQAGANDCAADPLPKIYRALWNNRAYFFTVMGYAAYTFVVGGVAFWMPAYLVRSYGIPLAKANLVFGALTVVAGFLGTMLGGALGDRWQIKWGDGYMKVAALSAFLSIPFCILALEAKSFTAVAIALFGLEFFLFLSTSPVNTHVMNCVPVGYRTTANAVCIFAIHLFGDALSPALMGFISDRSSLHLAMYIAPIGMFCAGVYWLSKVIMEWEVVDWPKNALPLPILQCHRGFRAKNIQENTLAAFRAAKAAGATMIELDVRLASDGIVVVVHDSDIKRVSGKEGVVAALTSQQLKNLAQIPSLLEVLTDSTCPAHVNIEIKSESFGDGKLESGVATVIAQAEAEGRVIISSFNPLALRRMARHLPEVPRALLATDEDTPKNKIYLREFWLAWIACPHILNIDAHYLDARPALAFNLNARHIPFAVWTVNNAEKAKQYLASGARSIISDNPILL